MSQHDTVQTLSASHLTRRFSALTREAITARRRGDDVAGIEADQLAVIAEWRRRGIRQPGMPA